MPKPIPISESAVLIYEEKDIEEPDSKRRKVEDKEEYDLLETYKWLLDEEAEKNTEIRIAKAELEKKVIAQYPKLSIDEIKNIVVEKKWMANMEQRIRNEMDNISHRLTQRIKELADRYETPIPKLTNDVAQLTSKVEDHLKKMNYKW